MERESFLKAKDVIEIIASSEMQAIFAQKAITKPKISIKTGHHWLKNWGGHTGN
jgi:hypothetical protein